MNTQTRTEKTRGESVGTTVREHNKPRHRRGESGNVLFIILIAVALLASLSYAVTQSTRGGTDAFTKERNALMSDEIISYGNTLANAVGQLRLRGCSTNQISFENNISALYANGSAPSDNTCHVFHPEGGGMTYQLTDPKAITDGGTGIYFDGSMEIEDIGRTCGAAACSDLTFYVRDLKQGTCIQLNNKLSVTNPSDIPPVDNDVDFDPFTGAYTYDLTLGDTVTSATIAGRKSACVQESSGSTYTFYRVLIAR